MSQPNEHTAATAAQLNRMYSAVDYVADLEGQDRSLVIEMSQAMLLDVIERGGLKPLVEYVQRYCDVLESADDAERIAEDI